MQQKRISQKRLGLDIGQSLRAAREKRNLSRGKLAKLTGLTGQAIAQVETGAREPSFKTLVVLARSLRLSLDALVGLHFTESQQQFLRDAGLFGLVEKIGGMPPEAREEVKNFVDFVWQKRVKKKRKKEV
ncbi:MAG: helix-turn-helix domain-containing protein [Kiritimatiellae bacterium]|nr:helix-turn-helix domain-containing protein [Kiritimatiellia bacterium]